MEAAEEEQAAAEDEAGMVEAAGVEEEAASEDEAGTVEAAGVEEEAASEEAIVEETEDLDEERAWYTA